ncbi:MAG: S-layer homology domain-containing protein [Oscillospiraceae bacterium]|nr:S-layer homology domain-containing protein [Oscillospiraceae bacterium]
MFRKRLVTSWIAILLVLCLSIPVGAVESAYTDVSEDAWYAASVAYCTEHELMNGVGNGCFQPQSEVSRAMAVTVLYRMAGEPQPVEATSGFPDVPEGTWYSPAVAWAVEAELVRGYEDGDFLPGQSITREELATLFWRYTGSPELKREPEPFADDGEISAFAVEAVYWCREAGVVNGVGENRFAPRGQATRAQLAQFLMAYDTLTKRTLISLGEHGAPCGIAAAPDGSLLVTDTYAHKVWLVRDGKVQVYAGADTALNRNAAPMGGYNDASLSESWFSIPWAIAPYRSGWAVSDAGNNVLRYLDETGVQTINVRIPSKSGSLSYPTGLAADDTGNLYVSDTHYGAIYRISENGALDVWAEGLDNPMGLCWKDDVLYVAETGGNRILTVRDGIVEVLTGTGEMGDQNGTAEEAAFAAPQGITVGEDGSVYIADTVNAALRVLRPDGMVETLLERSEAGMDIYPISPVGLLVFGNKLYFCDNYARWLISLPLD